MQHAVAPRHRGICRWRELPGHRHTRKKRQHGGGRDHEQFPRLRPPGVADHAWGADLDDAGWHHYRMGDKKMYWWRNGYLEAALSAPLPTVRPVVASSDFADGYLIGPQSDLWLVRLTIKHVHTMRPHDADMRSGMVSSRLWLPALSGTYTGTRGRW